MPNANKNKGDREERAVRDIARANGFPGAERTRAGYARDAGDVHLDPGMAMAPGVILSVKDVRTPDWSKWLEQLASQKAEAGADVAFISAKRSRPGKAPLRLAVLPLEDMLTLLRYADYGTPLEDQ